MDVVLDTPAYKAGVGPGMKLVGVNSRRFSPKVLDEVLAATKKPGNPVVLLIEDGDFFRTYTLNYQGAGGTHTSSGSKASPTTSTKSSRR